MHVLIAIALIALVVGGAVYLSVTLLASVAYFLTMPSLVGMSPVRFVGLTDPGWSVILHAALGGLLGFWAHLATPWWVLSRRVKVLLIVTVIAMYIFAAIVVSLLRQ